MVDQGQATRADIEPLAAVVRVIPSGAYGDPYTWSATLRWLDRYTVEVMGAMRAPRPSEWRAVRAALRKAEVRRVVWHRADGRDRERTH